jgi:drug/metabolite transporter (DMT)-like permease
MHGLMLVATFCWAGNMVALKDALAGFNPLALALLRVAGAAIVYLTLFLLIRRKLPRRLTAREWWVLSLVAMSGVTFNQLFFVGGIARSTVAHAGLIVALGPIMVLVLSCLMRLEALTIPKFVGMLISFAGVAVLTIGKAGRLNGGHLVGDLILLAGSAVFAYYTILVKEVADRYDPLTLNALAYAIGVILILPFTVGSLADVQWQRVPLYSWWGVGFAILLGSVVPYLVFAYVMSELTAARVAAFAYIQPVIATGLGIWLLREHLTVKVVVGGILILAGVYLTERERGEERAIE